MIILRGVVFALLVGAYILAWRRSSAVGDERLRLALRVFLVAILVSPVFVIVQVEGGVIPMPSGLSLAYLLFTAGVDGPISERERGALGQALVSVPLVWTLFFSVASAIKGARRDAPDK